MKKLAIFASGSGSNAENIIQYFESNPSVEVPIILSNRKDAFVHQRAERLGVPSVYFSRSEFYSTNNVLALLQEHEIDFIILAGFLWLVPDNLLAHFPNKIINVHPALLPKYGGKGMFGDNVHRAVVAQGEKESGITIHYVNENYDEGQVIFQAECAVEAEDDYETLAQKVHALEYEHFPKIIESLL